MCIIRGTALHRRTRHRAKRAEDAAMSGVWAQQCVTAAALVEELAGVLRHRQFFSVTTFRAGEDRLALYRHQT